MKHLLFYGVKNTRIQNPARNLLLTFSRNSFEAELEFPKILVTRLPQHTSNVNIEFAGKAKRL